MMSAFKLFGGLKISGSLIERCHKLYIQQKFQGIPYRVFQRLYAKEVYKREKPHCNIGTIGHADHGKTTLTAAITKILSQKKLAVFKKYEDIDHDPMEKERGITINYNTIEYSTENRRYSHKDCPGHAEYIKNMITGASQMDGAIMVVAGTDGIMPQTREHLLLAKFIGLKRLVIFINKADIANKRTLEVVEMEIRKLFTKMGFNGDETPVIHGSALAALEGKDDEIGAKSIAALLEAIDSYIPTPERALDKPFLLPIEDVYHIEGSGTVVWGHLERGILKKGNEAEILGFGTDKIKTVITGLETFHKTLEEAHAGDPCGILLSGVKRKDVKKGMVLAKPNTLSVHDNFESHVYILTREEGGVYRPIFSLNDLRVFSKSWNVSSKVFLQGTEMVMPGETATFNIRLMKPMVMEKGQRFTLRTRGKTIGTGVIADIKPNMTKEEVDHLLLPRKMRGRKNTVEN